MMDKNLMMTICLCLGILCWAVAAYFAVRYRKDVKSVIRAVGLGVFASLFFFIYPFAVSHFVSFPQSEFFFCISGNKTLSK